MQTLKVNGYSEQWLRKGFPWVYPKEISQGQKLRSGGLVRVASASGLLLGIGLSDTGWIAARVFRYDDGPLDQQWLDGVLNRALAHRRGVLGDDTTGYRIVHAENDGLPGVRIDWWGHFAVIILDSPSIKSLLGKIQDWLERTLQPRGIYLTYRLDSRDSRGDTTLNPAPGLLAGMAPRGDVKVLERGLTIMVRPQEGPDVGLYSDMRDVRAFLEPHWGGRRVLNTFCYTGAFSVAAAYYGASHVVSVDLSSRYLDRAEENFRANNLDPASHDFIAEDSLKAMDRLRRKGDLFDLVLLDPPTSSHGPEGHWSAGTGWPRLVAAAARLVTPGGWLVAASNQGELSPHKFRGAVGKGLQKVKRTGQLLHWGGQAVDFPAATTFPEGSYLKVGVWRLH